MGMQAGFSTPQHSAQPLTAFPPRDASSSWQEVLAAHSCCTRGCRASASAGCWLLTQPDCDARVILDLGQGVVEALQGRGGQVEAQGWSAGAVGFQQAQPKQVAG